MTERFRLDAPIFIPNNCPSILMNCNKDRHWGAESMVKYVCSMAVDI